MCTGTVGGGCYDRLGISDQFDGVFIAWLLCNLVEAVAEVREYFLW